MKNITVSVPDHVYHEARARAGERGGSVSALVAEFLTSLSGGDAQFARLEAQQRRVQDQIARFGAGDRLERDDLHRRVAARELRSSAVGPT